MNRRFFVKIISMILLLLYSVQIMCAASSTDEMITVSSDGSTHSQDIINSAIEAASNAGGGIVYLKSGVYEVDGTIVMRSNIRLTGDPDAIIMVSSSSSQWFTGSTGVISCQEPVKNVEIYGFQVNGNCINLNPGLANTAGHDKDCEKLIILHGNSGDYAENVAVHDMQLYDSFSDGMYIYYAKNVQCYNNFISNTQHEGIFWSVVINGQMYGNKIAGITSDCARLDNCVNCKVHDNVFFSYNGDHTNGAYKNGHNGLQVANAGSSHGYDASNKPTTTTNIEVYNNVFANGMLDTIWVHSIDQSQVYLHDNRMVDGSELADMGIPMADVNFTNMPTKEKSKMVFNTIFKVLDLEFTESGKTNQSLESINYTTMPETKNGVLGGIDILGFKDIVVIDKVPYIESNDSILIKAAAMNTPGTGWQNGWVQKNDKNVDITYKNDTVTATLVVKSKTTTPGSINKITGKAKVKTKTAVFNDSYTPAPHILKQPDNITGIIYVYPTSFQVYVPPEGLVKIKYKYMWNETEHLLLSGVRNETEEGIKFTEYTHVNRWKGDIDHQGDWINVIGVFDQKMLHVTVDTPYQQIPVNNFEIIYKPYPKRAIAWWFYPFLASLIITILYIVWLCRDFKRY